ncbi:MAG: FecR domain-containing protein [Acidobacteriaceae bacterium]|nr:FecR domain-containing protein [Acidobacteriaceae bacterium]
MMNDDYLWDRSGEPDEEIARLEKVLGPLRLPQTDRTPITKRVHSNVARRWMWAAAAAALVMGAFLAVWRKQTAGAETSWRLLHPGAKASAIRTGQVIETSPAQSAALESEWIGRVDIAGNSRLRLLSSQRNGQQRLALDHGTIHALIWAPPAQFVVDTPAAKAVDLGCQYTLQVAEDGSGLLTVETGWVAFQWHHRESFIPAGAACRTRPGHGPDTPYFLDAPEKLTKAVGRFDMADDAGALRNALNAARPRDAFTVWHLLTRTQGSQRGEVFDRFSELVKLPQTIDRAAIINGDQRAIDTAWNALELGDTSWWREWKRDW